MQKAFEIGPIRPPSEAESLLLRITRNCSWNKCKFCNLYTGHNFSARPIEEVKADIDQVALMREDILSWTSDGEDESRITEKIYSLPLEMAQRYFHVLQWMGSGEDSVFLQDANTVALSFNRLREILVYLREKLPQVKRVTSYGRVDSLDKFSPEQLIGLREAGLDRIHSGFESGSDKVLEFINKGYTKAQEIEVGRKVKESGVELSIYYMPGVGGADLSDDNALETADVIDKINPDFVRVRTFVPRTGTGLMEDIKSGKMKECTDIQKMQELKKMIENVNSADGYLYSDHIINLFEDVNGNLKTDKQNMLDIFEAFEKLGKNDRRRYQIARRMGMVRSHDYMRLLRDEQIKMIDSQLLELDTDEKFEHFISRLLRRGI